LATLVLPRPAAGQSVDPVEVTVSDFDAVTLNGTPRTTTAVMSDFSVSDSAGLGWHVTIDATQFAEIDAGGQYVTGGRILPVGSLAMVAPTVEPADPAVTITAGPYALDGTTTKIATAASGSAGTFVFTQTGRLTLSLPASAYARSYRSEVTVAVHSGP
jgi:hypothetical protein